MYNSVAAFFGSVDLLLCHKKQRISAQNLCFSTKYWLYSPYKNKAFHINIRFTSMPRESLVKCI